MSTFLYLESVAGVAGDMFASAFVDAGLVTADELQQLPVKLGLCGVHVEFTPQTRAHLACTGLHVSWNSDDWKSRFGHRHSGHDEHVNHDYDPRTNVLVADQTKVHWHTHYLDITKVISASNLEAPVRERALAIFELLACAEAKAHGTELSQVAFHELGTIDSILDVVMAAYCIEKLKPGKIYASPIRPGRGVVSMQHGTLPVPPPASAQLLLGLSITSTPKDIARDNIELSTPTGIAIIKSLNPIFVNELPQGTMRFQGMGCGTMNLDPYPNVFRVIVLSDESQVPSPWERDQVTELSFNIDDDTAEHVAWLCEKALELGALDVWTTPFTGKKGRSGVCLSLLCNEAIQDTLIDFLLRKSTTFGLRTTKWHRYKLQRHMETRDSDQGPVRYKIGKDRFGNFIKQKPECDDIKRDWDTSSD